MKNFITCVALSSVLLVGCSASLNNDAVVKVNDKAIIRAEFDKAFDKEVDNSFLKSFGGAANLQKTEDNVMYIMFKDKVTNELIVKSLLDQEITKRGIKVKNEDIKAEMKSIIDKVGSKDELNKILKERGIKNSEFTDDLKTQIKIKKLINSIEKVKISDNEAEKYYKTHTAEFKHGEQVKASHILVSADTIQIIRDIKAKNKDISATDLNKQVEEVIGKQKAKAEAILAEVKANPDNFEKIAQKESDDKVSGARGGELGFFGKDAMVKEFANASFAMKPNTVSNSLVKTPYGFHIIKVTDRMEAGVTPFVKIKDEIKFYLETQKQIEILKNLTNGLMKTAKIEYVDETFKPHKDLAKKINEAAKTRTETK